mmetsp:Transcript_42627/g.129442  ORF Transcript_42627/g.129442 Transcript_42627/m.129442 type:complete len:215 (+) Transcript_42627:822-1466(+)
MPSSLLFLLLLLLADDDRAETDADEEPLGTTTRPTTMPSSMSPLPFRRFFPNHPPTISSIDPRGALLGFFSPPLPSTAARLLLSDALLPPPPSNDDEFVKSSHSPRPSSTRDDRDDESDRRGLFRPRFDPPPSLPELDRPLSFPLSPPTGQGEGSLSSTSSSPRPAVGGGGFEGAGSGVNAAFSASASAFSTFAHSLSYPSNPNLNIFWRSSRK